MKVTPLDLRQQKFKTVMRGYDRAEVESFLAETADDYETALRDADRLRDDLARAQSSLEEHREGERNLRNTLLTAQKLADEIRLNAGLRLKRRDVESSLEGTIAALRNALEFVREQDVKEREDKVLLHRPRTVETPPAPTLRVFDELKETGSDAVKASIAS